MDTPTNPQTGHSRIPGRTPRGFALVVVLTSLVFVTVLIVAFLVSMQTEVMISKSSYDASGGRLLANTCVNLAISQVQAATQAAAANSYAWASQPGMIRLYDNTGRPAGFCKLYSSGTMVGTGAFNSSLATPDDPISATWYNDTALWTDLNAPVSTTLPGGTQQNVYPIVNPASIDTNPAEGVVSPATAIDQFTVSNSTPLAPVGTNPNAVPMPVKWLYVLQDGTVLPATSGNGTRVVVSGAKVNNPIVGRIAFWTDDDSCKININTASHGTFWDTPRFNTPTEMAFATSQPIHGEYQRYPGHPAMACLDAAFPNLTADQIFGIAPRLTNGGSMGGTVLIKDITLPVTLDSDRLYASVEEMLFSPQMSGTTRQMNTAITAGALSKPQVQDAPFFLTAASRAPELNLFGKPRVCIWPEHNTADNNYRTAIDRLIAFCSTTGTAGGTTYPFYFTRRNPLSPTEDISLPRNLKLLNYLDTLTGQTIPGFGGSFQTKYTQPESRQILTEIFDYIRCTNLFDCTTPLSNGNYPYAFAVGTYLGVNKGKRDHSGNSYLSTAVPASIDWSVVTGAASTTGTTGGFGGHFMQVAEASIWFVALGKGKPSVSSTTAAIPIDSNQIGTRVGTGWDITNDPSGLTPKPGITAVQAYLVLNFLTPGQGVAQWCPGTWVEISGLDQFGLKKNPSDSPARASKTYLSIGWAATAAREAGKSAIWISAAWFAASVLARRSVRRTLTKISPFSATFCL